jgi:hypothetical protein
MSLSNMFESVGIKVLLTAKMLARFYKVFIKFHETNSVKHRQGNRAAIT